MAEDHDQNIKKAIDSTPLRQMIGGAKSTQLIYVAAKLGIADLLHQDPKNYEELSRILNVNATALHRVLRGLVNRGILLELQDGRFCLTPLGELLKSDAPGRLRGLAIRTGDMHYRAWGELLYTVQTGGSAFEHVYGMNFFDFLSKNPEMNDSFSQSMVSMTDETSAAIVDAYDFSSIKTVADIGGGYGALIASILNKYPQMKGILFETESVITGAQQFFNSIGIESRCKLVSGDFFASVPGNIDAYILKAIIHNWDDDNAVRILTNCRKVMNSSSKLLLIEGIMVDHIEQYNTSVEFDLIMLVTHGGQERTKSEYEALLVKSGFVLNRIIKTRSDLSIIEALPK